MWYVVGMSSGLLWTCVCVQVCVCVDLIVFVCRKVELHKYEPAFGRLVECVYVFMCLGVTECNCVCEMLSKCEGGLKREPEKGRAE